ncbi:MAG: glycosyltransferase [Methylacidiphilaceae bacterium]|nr:glycosyltransferase [Candidatus Methylacidiphilaceae bacterium]
MEIPPFPPPSRSQSARLRVGLLTGELAGVGPSSGLGSLVASLAETLAEAGLEVTVVLAPEKREETQVSTAWTAKYAHRRVRVVPLPEPAIRCFEWPRSSSRAYKAYVWLRQHAAEFDRVVFCDRGGLGYYALLAKHQGLGFRPLPLGVLLHSPTLRRTLDNTELVEDHELLIADFLERESARLADGVAATSEALLRSLEAEGWIFPEDRRSLPPPLPASLLSLRKEEKEPFVPEEIVFFSPLESRKRLRIFCEGIDRLPASGTGKLRITFLGRSGRIEGIPGREHVARRVAGWPHDWKILGQVEREEALGYLREGKRLAVVGSASPGLSLAAWECACLRIPVLRVGANGSEEALAGQRWPLIPGNPEALAARLREALRLGIAAPKAPIDPSEIRKGWTDWLTALPSPQAEPSVGPFDPPKVSVCLVHHDRPSLLAQALESLRAQDYPNFEVVLVDDGSATQEAAAFLDKIEAEFTERGWRIVRQPNLYLGAARNRAVREAKGEFFLFMDDDNLAEPHEISTFVRVALRTGAAILTSAQREFEGKEALGAEGRSSYVFAPLGPALSLGVLWNLFGDANALVRRDAFEAIGGFSDARSVPCEDWEFFGRAVLAGFPLEMVPEPLFWYRRSREGMYARTSLAAGMLRALRPYRKAFPSLSGALLLTQGKFAQAEAFWREGCATRQEIEAARDQRDRLQNILNQKEQELWEARDELSRIHRSRIWRLGVRLRRWEQKLRNARRALFHRSGDRLDGSNAD